MEFVTKRAAIVTLCVAAVADIATTIIGIEYAGLVEFNSFVQPLMDRWGYAGLIPPTVYFIGVALAGAWVIERRAEYGKVGGVAAVYCCAAVKLLAASWNSVLIVSVM